MMLTVLMIFGIVFLAYVGIGVLFARTIFSGISQGYRELHGIDADVF